MLSGLHPAPTPSPTAHVRQPPPPQSSTSRRRAARACWKPPPVRAVHAWCCCRARAPLHTWGSRPRRACRACRACDGGGSQDQERRRAGPRVGVHFPHVNHELGGLQRCDGPAAPAALPQASRGRGRASQAAADEDLPQSLPRRRAATGGLHSRAAGVCRLPPDLLRVHTLRRARRPRTQQVRPRTRAGPEVDLCDPHTCNGTRSWRRHAHAQVQGGRVADRRDGDSHAGRRRPAGPAAVCRRGRCRTVPVRCVCGVRPRSLAAVCGVGADIGRPTSTRPAGCDASAGVSTACQGSRFRRLVGEAGGTPGSARSRAGVIALYLYSDKATIRYAVLGGLGGRGMRRERARDLER